ncbi:hypothetical protein CNECB9_820014 [Cupriavidus necator]|uniref:Uncharacterized protein n=1 Tax=Cupriavidus necator TaxID=106590 RepID=A0A1K0ISI0_CUPNE|nr:hypothetical protein CNECB9_820014 [Cupriavidus necator]
MGFEQLAALKAQLAEQAKAAKAAKAPKRAKPPRARDAAPANPAKPRHNCSTPQANCATAHMSTAHALLESIRKASAGSMLTELLAQHPDVARRTAQRWISQWIDGGQITAIGEGRARRYFVAKATGVAATATEQDRFPGYIPLSADSRDIVAYIDQPPAARKPVGYQRDFLDAYQPNVTRYLPESLRRQLHKMGKTAQADAPSWNL